MDTNGFKKNEEKIAEEVEVVEEAQGETKDPLAEKIEELENKYRRALADYQNLEKRQADERRHWIVSANRELLLRLLPVLDTLMLAKKHSEDKTLQVTINQFLDVLKNEGVIKIETVGQKFDPHLMEAIDTKTGNEGKVLEEVMTGYMLHDKLLRAAQVVVGSAKQNKKE